jgi:hypothetical protein
MVYKKRATIPLAVRFWSHVDKHGPLPHAKAIVLYPEIADTVCWEWTGKPGINGRGRINIGIYLQKIVRYVTHVSVYLETGEWPASPCVLHKCDNPICVRFSHLFQGTQAENVADCISKNRDNPWGHK